MRYGCKVTFVDERKTLTLLCNWGGRFVSCSLPTAFYGDDRLRGAIAGTNPNYRLSLEESR
jgi:hypothetical protein